MDWRSPHSSVGSQMHVAVCSAPRPHVVGAIPPWNQAGCHAGLATVPSAEGDLGDMRHALGVISRFFAREALRVGAHGAEEVEVAAHGLDLAGTAWHTGMEVPVPIPGVAMVACRSCRADVHDRGHARYDGPREAVPPAADQGYLAVEEMRVRRQVVAVVAVVDHYVDSEGRRSLVGVAMRVGYQDDSPNRYRRKAAEAVPALAEEQAPVPGLTSEGAPARTHVASVRPYEAGRDGLARAERRYG